MGCSVLMGFRGRGVVGLGKLVHLYILGTWGCMIRVRVDLMLFTARKSRVVR
jgi:hypothetical protein